MFHVLHCVILLTAIIRVQCHWYETSTASLTISTEGVLQFLNVRWEGRGAVNSTVVRTHPLFPGEENIGPCPTFYELIPLSHSSVPTVVLTGRCWTDCYGSSCRAKGPAFTCTNRIENIPIVDYNSVSGKRETTLWKIPVGCYCTEEIAHMLEPVFVKAVQ